MLPASGVVAVAVTALQDLALMAGSYGHCDCYFAAAVAWHLRKISAKVPGPQDPGQQTAEWRRSLLVWTLPAVWGHMQEWAGGARRRGLGQLTHVSGHPQAFKSRCRSLLGFVKGAGVGALDRLRCNQLATFRQRKTVRRDTRQPWPTCGERLQNRPCLNPTVAVVSSAESNTRKIILGLRLDNVSGLAASVGT